MSRRVQLGWRWSPRRASPACRSFSWSCLAKQLRTHFGLEVLELDLVADSCVGLCDILGVDPGLRAVGVGYLRVRREQVLVDVLVELLRSRSPTLMLLMLIR